MRPLLMPGDSPWRIKAIIAALAAFYIWARFFMPAEPEEMETLSMQAKVMSDNSVIEAQQSSSFRLIRVQLPDDTQAFVSWSVVKPQQGDAIDVKVRVLDDGTRQVSLVEF